MLGGLISLGRSWMAIVFNDFKIQLKIFKLYPVSCVLCSGGGVWLQQSHPAQLLPHQTGEGAGGERRAAQGLTGTLCTLFAR